MKRANVNANANGKSQGMLQGGAPGRAQTTERTRAGKSPPGALVGTLIESPAGEPSVFVAADGTRRVLPADWECLPPGDAGLTRRVKQAGPSWAVVEKRGRKVFSKGLWAPRDNIAAARAALLSERATDTYARRRQSELARRERTQEAYVQTFAEEVLAFIDFAPGHAELARRLAERVTAHATPVGSGTVARTQRIRVAERAEAAVIAWMRHQTTAYDHLQIPRVKGMRRQVRRELARVAHELLSRHRRDELHAAAGCPLCRALS